VQTVFELIRPMAPMLHLWIMLCMGAAGIFSEGQNIYGRKFEIDGTGTSKDATYKNRTAKSVNILNF